MPKKDFINCENPEDVNNNGNILETEKKLLVRPDTTVHLVISLVNWLQ